jgi:hypothetical protein
VRGVRFGTLGNIGLEVDEKKQMQTRLIISMVSRPTVYGLRREIA